MKEQLAKKAGRAALYSLLAVLSLLVWVPLWMLFSGTFLGKQELLQNLSPVLAGNPEPPFDGYAVWPVLPQFPTLASWVELLLDTPRFFSMFWNSCGQVLPILAGQLLLGAPAAWAFGRFSFRGKRLLFGLYTALMLLPFQVTMVSSFLALDAFHLLDTFWAVIVPGAVSTFPIFIMTQFFAAIPSALLEAAYLDGAGPFRAFVKIGLPLGLPGIISAGTLSFLDYWNAMEQPLAFLKDKALWPLSLYLPEMSAENIASSFAASMFILIPALLIFLFGQGYLEQGILAAGIKE